MEVAGIQERMMIDRILSCDLHKKLQHVDVRLQIVYADVLSLFAPVLNSLGGYLRFFLRSKLLVSFYLTYQNVSKIELQVPNVIYFGLVLKS